MTEPVFHPVAVRPCTKCGTSDRYKTGRCKACHTVSVAAWRNANIEKARSDCRAYRLANPEKIKATEERYVIENAGKIKEAAKAWRLNNPEKAKAMADNWRAKNPDAHRIYAQNRRALKVKSGGRVSQGLKLKLFSLQKGMCPCCKQPLGEGYHLDHIMPLALGGSNTDDNIQLLRAGCNLSKHADHPVDFMQSRGFLL